MFTLEIEGKQYNLPNGNYLIGRKTLNNEQVPDIAVQCKSVTGLHALLIVDHDSVRLIDLKSKTGSYVGNKRISDLLITKSVDIRFGQLLAKLQIGKTTDKLHDRIGFHNINEVICPTPRRVAQNVTEQTTLSRILLPQYGNSINKNQKNDSFQIPETQRFADDSYNVFNESSIRESNSAFSYKSKNIIADESDFLIPETQDICSNKRHSGSSENLTAMIEQTQRWCANTSMDSDDDIRICTQDYNESSEDTSTSTDSNIFPFSALIPHIRHAQINGKSDILNNNTGEPSDADVEMNTLDFTKNNTSAADDTRHAQINGKSDILNNNTGEPTDADVEMNTLDFAKNNTSAADDIRHAQINGKSDILNNNTGEPIDADVEMNTLDFTKNNTLAADVDRSDMCTPDLFDLPDDGAIEHKNRDSCTPDLLNLSKSLKVAPIVEEVQVTNLQDKMSEPVQVQIDSIMGNTPEITIIPKDKENLTPPGKIIQNMRDPAPIFITSAITTLDEQPAKIIDRTKKSLVMDSCAQSMQKTPSKSVEATEIKTPLQRNNSISSITSASFDSQRLSDTPQLLQSWARQILPDTTIDKHTICNESDDSNDVFEQLFQKKTKCIALSSEEMEHEAYKKEQFKRTFYIKTPPMLEKSRAKYGKKSLGFATDVAKAIVKEYGGLKLSSPVVRIMRCDLSAFTKQLNDIRQSDKKRKQKQENRTTIQNMSTRVLRSHKRTTSEIEINSTAAVVAKQEPTKINSPLNKLESNIARRTRRVRSQFEIEINSTAAVVAKQEPTEINSPLNKLERNTARRTRRVRNQPEIEINSTAAVVTKQKPTKINSSLNKLESNTARRTRRFHSQFEKEINSRAAVVAKQKPTKINSSLNKLESNTARRTRRFRSQSVYTNNQISGNEGKTLDKDNLTDSCKMTGCNNLIKTKKIKIAKSLLQYDFSDERLTKWVTLVDDPTKCDILIISQPVRTFKFLVALVRGIPILKPSWLDNIKLENAIKFMKADIFVNAELEKKYDFSILESSRLARNQKVFLGYEFLMTPNIRPNPSELKTIIICTGGKVLQNVLESSPEAVAQGNLYLISNENDKSYWDKEQYSNPQVKRVSTDDFILAILRQNVEPLNNSLI